MRIPDTPLGEIYESYFIPKSPIEGTENVA